MASSKAWLYFEKIEESPNVRCKLCKVVLSRKDANTSSMNKHLKRKHEIDVMAQKAQERSPSQPTLTAVLEAKKPFDRDHPTQKNITQAVAKFIAVDMQPLDVVNDWGFKNLIRVLEPRYACHKKFINQ